MENREAIRKIKFMRDAYQKLIDENVDEGRLVGTDVTGMWKADTPLNEVYREHIDALDLAISALEKQERDRWIPVTERLPEKDCRCRVTEGDFKYVFDCYWSNCKKQFEFWSNYCDGYVTITNVTAWKPKEEPYTEEQ